MNGDAGFTPALAVFWGVEGKELACFSQGSPHTLASPGQLSGSSSHSTRVSWAPVPWPLLLGMRWCQVPLYWLVSSLQAGPVPVPPCWVLPTRSPAPGHVHHYWTILKVTCNNSFWWTPPSHSWGRYSLSVFIYGVVGGEGRSYRN